MPKRILLALCCLVGSMSLYAAIPIPQDSAVVMGQLPNGLTYYIRHNNYIPNRASFYIAQKVGAIQETPAQRGLAHFLEHMAFNGTTHFPGNSLVNYLETIGVKFSDNLNAQTGVDQTVYMIDDVPTERVSTVDSCLLILRDWSDGILLEDEAIDKERGVIEEEWRQRSNPVARMREKELSCMFEGDKYADCLPIGNIEVVRHCPYDTLRAYYKTWYHPDLQGIVVVGDIDVAQTEATIQRMFSAIQMPQGCPERVYYPITPYKEPRIIASTDAEMPFPMLAYRQKVTSIPDSLQGTDEGFKQEWIREMVTSVLNDRFNEMKQEAMPPFADTYVMYDDFMVTSQKKCISVNVQAGNEGLAVAIYRFFDEMERLRRYGFTQAELNRCKNTSKSYIQQGYAQRNHVSNGAYIWQCVNHFLEKDPIPSATWRYHRGIEIIESVTLEDVSAWIASWDLNDRLVWMLGSDTAQFPSIEWVKEQINLVQSKELAPYPEQELATAIVPQEFMAEKGSIKSKKQLKNGVVWYQLSNGVNVYHKPTDFKEDEIILSAVSQGGAMQIDPSDWINARFATSLAFVGGMGAMSNTDLEKYLSDKQVSLHANIEPYTESISGRAAYKDVETLFEMLYGSFHTLRASQAAFDSYKQRFVAQTKDYFNNPYAVVFDSIAQVTNNKHPLLRMMRVEDIEQVDYMRSMQLYKQRFANAADFTFVVVGDIDAATLDPLLETYLASLRANKKREKVKKEKPLETPGSKKVRFTIPMQLPASIVYLHTYTPLSSSDKDLSYALLDDILKLVYTEKVREEQGGTYGVETHIMVDDLPSRHATLTISFMTDADKVGTLLPIVYQELETIAQQGPSPENLQKVKEYLRKRYAELQKSNDYWVARIQDTQVKSKDALATYLQRLDKISSKDIQKAANKLLKSDNLKEIISVGVPQ